MNLGTAASIGMGLLRNREQVGQALSGLSGLAKLGGQGFAKIAQRVEAELGALQEAAGANGVSTLQALNGLSTFDADRNGQVSKEELTQGLQRLDAAGLHGNGQFQQLRGMADLMLKNYDKVAQLDGNGAGISYRDLGKLAGSDGKVTTLTQSDWTSLNA